MTNKTIEIDGKIYNVYATVEEADNYFAASFGSEWAEIGAQQKPQLLVTATRKIDTKDYEGEKLDKNQPLKFPRMINGAETDEELLTTACCELANNIFSEGGKEIQTDNISSVSLGDSTIKFKDDVKVESKTDSILEDYLGNYLLGGIRVIL